MSIRRHLKIEEVKDQDNFFQEFQKSGVVDINETHGLSMTQCLQQFRIFKSRTRRKMMLCTKFEAIHISCFQVIKTLNVL